MWSSHFAYPVPVLTLFIVVEDTVKFTQDISGQKIVKELHLKYSSFEKCVVDTAKQLIPFV